MNRKMYYAILVLALSTLACSVSINLPFQEIETGPTVTDDLFAALPDGETAEVVLEFAAGELYISPGAEDALLSGEAAYNVEEFAPELVVNGSRVTLTQGDLDFDFIPVNFDNDFKNEWDLQFATGVPMSLRIDAGAYLGDFDLGGLALEELRIRDGASDVRVDFSEPNPVEMDTLRYDTGASNVELYNLCNANFSKMYFTGGVGNYVLDFSGDFQRDATVEITAGLGNLVIEVPEGMNVVVKLDGGLTSVNYSSDFSRRGSAYEQSGDGPTLTINIDMGAGNLTLHSS